MSTGSHGRIGSRAELNYDNERQKREPTQDPTTFGRRMGANFFHDESNQSLPVPVTNPFYRNQYEPIRVRSREPTAIFKTEILEKCNDGKDDGGVQYRKKSGHKGFTNTEPVPAPKNSEPEDEIEVVASQLKWIQNTQDEILESLRHDIDIIQTENIILRQNNARLQAQVSQMNQLVSDLSFDLRQMRDLISSNQKLGMSVPLVDITSSKRYEEKAGVGRKKMATIEEVSSTSTPASMEPSDGSVSINSVRTKRRRQQNVSGDTSHLTNQKPSSKRTPDVDLASTGEKRSRRITKERKSAPPSAAPNPPPKKSSCFGGLFGGRKAVE